MQKRLILKIESEESKGVTSREVADSAALPEARAIYMKRLIGLAGDGGAATSFRDWHGACRMIIARHIVMLYGLSI